MALFSIGKAKMPLKLSRIIGDFGGGRGIRALLSPFKNQSSDVAKIDSFRKYYTF